MSYELTRRLLIAMVLTSLSMFSHAAYKSCGTSLVSYSTNTCPDGISSVYHSGDPITFSVDSSNFGSVTVATTSASKTIKITNVSGYSISLSSPVSISSGNFGISSTTCGSSLGIGASCEVAVAFTPASTGSITGNLQLTTIASTTPYALSLSGTGAAVVLPLTGISLASTSVALGGTVTISPIPTSATLGTCSSSNNSMAAVSGSQVTAGNTTGVVTITCSGKSTSLNITAPVPTLVTKPAPTTCSSSISGSKLTIPYLVVNSLPMWVSLESTGDVLSYRVVDYGPLSGTASCTADGATFDGASVSAAKLYYGGDYYKVGMGVSVSADGVMYARILSGEKVVQTPTTSSSPGGNNQSVLVGKWALHSGGLSTVTFLNDGTYSSDNGGSGTYSWSGDKLSITGALTSGNSGTGYIEVAASATWLEIYWMSSYGYEVGQRYYKMN